MYINLRLHASLQYVGAGDGALAAQNLQNLSTIRAVTKVTLLVGTTRSPNPQMLAKKMPSVSTDAGCEDTSDDLDMLCDLFCAPPHTCP